MHPLRTHTARTLVVTAGTALALSLGACGVLDDRTDREPAESQSAEAAQQTATSPPTEGTEFRSEGGAAGDGGPVASESAGDASGATATEAAGDPTDGSDDLWEDKAKTRSLAGDDGIEVDEDGDGRIPAAALEADLTDLFANKFDMDVTSVECAEDMEVSNWWGMEPCDVEADGQMYFGTVELVGTQGDMIEYEVMFPGIDEDELDLSDEDD